VTTITYPRRPDDRSVSGQEEAMRTLRTIGDDVRWLAYLVLDVLRWLLWWVLVGWAALGAGWCAGCSATSVWSIPRPRPLRRDAAVRREAAHGLVRLEAYLDRQASGAVQGRSRHDQRPGRRGGEQR
jgi:hypothetical protein